MIGRFSVAIAACAFPLTASIAGNGNGNLQQRIQQLEAIVGGLASGDHSVSVNCGAGQTISAAIASAPRASKVTITVNGTCNEVIEIARDDVAIEGPTAGTPSATIVGQLDIISSQRIALRDLIVRDSSEIGVMATRGSSMHITNVRITGHQNSALAVIQNSVVRVESSHLEGPATTQQTVVITDGGHMQMFGSTVISNSTISTGGGAAIGLYRGGNTRIRDGSTIRNTNPSATDPNRGAAIEVGDGSTVRIQSGANVVDGNIAVYDTSLVDLRDVTVSAFIGVRDQSQLEMRSSVVATGNAIVVRRSLFEVNGATYNGTIDCSFDGAVRGQGGASTNNCLFY